MHRHTTPRRMGAATWLCGLFLVSAVALAPAAEAATPANTAYVRSVYLDLLDRTSETSNDAGVTFWANRLETRTRGNVVRSIQTSTEEYYSKIVEFNYQLFLDRSADPAGHDFYVSAWRSRQRTLASVVAALGGSREYYALSGGTVDAFIDTLYFDVLGREVDPGGRAYAMGVIASSSRGTLALRLANSTEYRQKQVSFQYGSFLGREASVAERDFWVDRLRAGMRLEDFDAALVASAEYYAANSS